MVAVGMADDEQFLSTFQYKAEESVCQLSVIIRSNPPSNLSSNPFGAIGPAIGFVDINCVVTATVTEADALTAPATVVVGINGKGVVVGAKVAEDEVN